MPDGKAVEGGYSFKRVQAEVAKCDAPCANCHRRVTRRREREARLSAIADGGSDAGAGFEPAIDPAHEAGEDDQAPLPCEDGAAYAAGESNPGPAD